MKVLVCGGRSYGAFGRSPPSSLRYAEAFQERGIMCRVLDEAVAEGMTTIVHGGATGADAYAHRYAADHGVKAVMYEADWSMGPSAGPRRNQRMLDEENPDLVIAFPGSRGTADMIRRARKAEIKVREIK